MLPVWLRWQKNLLSNVSCLFMFNLKINKTKQKIPFFIIKKVVDESWMKNFS